MERPHLAHPANPRHRGSRHRFGGCGLPDALSLCRCRRLHQQRPEPDPGRAMEPHKHRFPASHQPPSSTRRVVSRVRTLPAQYGGSRLAAQPRTAMAPVPGPRPSQPDQPKATGHAGSVPAHVKPADPRLGTTNKARRRAAPLTAPRRATDAIRYDHERRHRTEPVVLAARPQRTGHPSGARIRRSGRPSDLRLDHAQWFALIRLPRPDRAGLACAAARAREPGPLRQPHRRPAFGRTHDNQVRVK